ncbi:hypothetical protein FRC02_007655, partial [Tulasnella sp. 418]
REKILPRPTHSAQTPAEKERDQFEQAERDSNEAASSAEIAARDTAQLTGTHAEQKEEGSSKLIPTEQEEGDADQPTRTHAEQKRGASTEHTSSAETPAMHTTEATVNLTGQKEEGSVTPTPTEQKEGDANQPTRTPDNQKEGDTSKSTSSAETTAEPKTSEPSNPLGSSSHTSREQEGDSYSSSSKPNKPAESHSNYFIKQRSSSDPSNSGERPVMSPVCLVEPIDGKKGAGVTERAAREQ